MLIIRGLADSLLGGCKIQGVVRQANYSPYYKKSATVGVNYSLTITLSMVLRGCLIRGDLFFMPDPSLLTLFCLYSVISHAFINDIIQSRMNNYA